ncbi:hypothetical protein Tco_1112506 [Tanacetum coccineum]|uniref:Uncharacterized protein n=1 Tax=Tanacetum coccineum TaxID=301880 RepID=A0ABQ5IPN2_9ASTR
MYQANQEERMTQTWMKWPQCCCRFHGPILHTTSQPTIQSMRYTPNDNQLLIMWIIRFQESTRRTFRLRCLTTEIDYNTFRINQYLLTSRAQNVPTEMLTKLQEYMLQRFNHANTNLFPCLQRNLKGQPKTLHQVHPSTLNPGLDKWAKRAQPDLYDADTLLHPKSPPFSIWDMKRSRKRESKRRYNELSQANTHSRTAYTEKLSALTAGNNQLKAQVTGTTSSGPSTSETPKVLAPGMYNLGSKYIPPPKRANWVKPTPVPKKKQVTFSETPRPSLKPTQKPVVHPNKQTNVCVPMSTGVKPTSGASKTVPKRAPRNHSSLPVKSANARKVEAHHRTLNKKNRVDSNLLVKHSVSVSNLNNVCGACNKSLVFANHNDCLVMCDDSVNVKPHQTKRFKRQPKNVGKPVKRVWKPISKPVANSKPQWKPTGRHFSLFEKHPLTRIMESTDQPIELPPSASSSPKITMVSRFADHKLSDRQAGSKGISGIFDC